MICIGKTKCTSEKGLLPELHEPSFHLLFVKGSIFLDRNGQREINISISTERLRKMNEQGNRRQKTLLNLKT